MNRGFARYAWAVLAYNILVILFGALVRATGSGNGCGANWPLCDGALIPDSSNLAQVIEYTHRFTSALAGLLVIILFVWAFRAYRPGHTVRRAAVGSLIFILTEGAVGAGLVLLELVGENDSLARAYWMAGHLINTFLLLGALSMTAWWATVLDADDIRRPIRLRNGRLALLVGAGLLLIMAGRRRVTALGDTLYPPASVGEVARTAEDAHFTGRCASGTVLAASAIYLYIVLATTMRDRHQPGVQRWARIAQLLVATQIAAGFVNVILLAPLWMQVVHLFLADSVWIALLLVGANALAAPAAEETALPRSLQAAAGS